MKYLMGIILFLLVLAMLYFLMIMPTIRHKPLQKELVKWLYAHRGLHDNATEAPENSLAAFRKAVEAGYGMELDVQLTKDRVPVVFHDAMLRRICGVEGKVSDYTFEELQRFSLCESTERIPAFRDVLSLVNGRTPLIVELKTETPDTTICRLVDEQLSDYQGVYCIESFNPCALLWYRIHRREVVRGQLADAFIRTGEFRGIHYWLLQNLMANFLSKPDFVAYNCLYPAMLSRRICHKLFHNMAAAWTVKSVKQLSALKDEFDIYIFEGFLPEKKI